MTKNLFEDFLTFEEKENLFDIKYDDFKIWEIARGYIYIEIQMIKNNLQPLFPTKKDSQNSKKISFNFFFNSFKFFFLKNIDYVFLNNPRRVKQADGKFYCIYTDLLIDLLKKEYSCVTLEDPYWSLSPTSSVSHFQPIKTENICFLDGIEYIYRFKKYIFKTFCKSKYHQLHLLLLKLEKKIEHEFNCELASIFKVVEDKILYMILTKKIYRKFIKRIKPKAIFEFYDIFPSKIVINKIAKELNIPIIELQHGIVTEKNPIFLKYSNYIRKYDCLPDYVFSYGKKLLNTNYMPINKKNIYYIGSLFLDKKINEYKNLKPKKKNILFISQSNLGDYLSKCASILSDLLKDDKNYQIIYKMHPYEIGNEYACLNKENITVINNRDKDLYYYQSISWAQVGVYSTGLYEGLNFGLKTFILSNCYGFSEIKDIVKEDNNIFYVKNSNEIFNILTKEQKLIKNSNHYWHKVDCDEILKIINNITSKHNKKSKKKHL